MPHTRNTRRVLISLLSADLAALDALAAELAEPGLAPNRSEAVRTLIRERSSPAPARRRKKPKVPRTPKGR